MPKSAEQGAAEPQGFDTTRRGAPEQEWADWAERLPDWVPPPTPLLVLSPHPDDETLAAGGLIERTLRAGASVIVLSLTDGEAACPEIEDLASLRQQELQLAMRDLSDQQQPQVIRLDLGDGNLAKKEAQIVEAVRDLVDDNTSIVAPVEFDGHTDHEAAGRAARRAAQVGGTQLIRYPIWAWYQGSSLLRTAATAVRLTLTQHGWTAKQRAIGQFRSQLDQRADGAIVPPHVLAYFKRSYEVFLL